jgi:hypothetical protein
MSIKKAPAERVTLGISRAVQLPALWCDFVPEIFTAHGLVAIEVGAGTNGSVGA